MASKAELRRIAAEVRQDLGLGDHEQFNPLKWAQHWGVPFVSITEIGASSEAVDLFTDKKPDLWSAALIKRGSRHVVFYNPAHAPVRILSDLAHEVAHLVAEHPLDATWMESDGKRCGAGRILETEAAELAGALLVPTEVAKVYGIRGWDAGALALKFGVSVDMAKWRIGQAGGTVIRQRTLAKNRR